MRTLLLLVTTLFASRATGDATIGTVIAPDRDGDGVPNSADLCPDDPEDKDGFEDEDGCPDPDYDDCFGCIGAFIYFRPNQSKLLPVYHAGLERLAAELRKEPKIRLVAVRVHTGSGGEPLARVRAKIVRDYLVGRGIGARRLAIRVVADDKQFVDFRILNPKPEMGG